MKNPLQVQLVCKCGIEFERPYKYKEWNETMPCVTWRWKLKYCDECYKKKVNNALKRLPEIINILAK